MAPVAALWRAEFGLAEAFVTDVPVMVAGRRARGVSTSGEAPKRQLSTFFAGLRENPAIYVASVASCYHSLCRYHADMLPQLMRIGNAGDGSGPTQKCLI
jgi:hypothetical protein